MAEKANGNPQDLLAQFHKDWRQALGRVEMARQTYAGAEADALAKEARFKGAAELVYGPEFSFTYSDTEGLRINRPNHDTRRALAKARRKKK